MLSLAGAAGDDLSTIQKFDDPTNPFEQVQTMKRKMKEWEDSLPKDEPSSGSDNNRNEDDC